MGQDSSVIAFLSAERASYERVQSLFSQASQRQFQVIWLDTTQVDLAKELAGYDIFLGDAPLEYLLNHLIFLKDKVCFWLTDSEIAQAELLNQQIADCFLWSEFNSDLFSHCLRRHQRTATTPSIEDPLTEFSGDRFQTLIKNIPGAVYRCLQNEPWQGMYVSDMIEEIVGYPAADFAPMGDRTLASFIYPDDLAYVTETIEQSLERKESFTLEYRVVDCNGVVRWVDERGQGVFDQNGNLLWIDGVIAEVTAQKQCQVQIAQQQLAYYEKTPAMLHVLNQQGEIVAISDRWLEVMGYRREEVIGRKSTEFLTIQSQAFAKKMLPLFYKQGQVNDVEYQFVKKDGEIIDISLSGRVDDSGAERLSLAILVDITTQNRLNTQLSIYQTRLQDLVRQRTEALAVSETRLRSVFDCAPVGIAETDLWGKFRFTNKRFAEMLGMDPLTLLDRSVFDITYNPDQALSEEILRQFRDGEITTLTCEKRYVRSDGSWFWGNLQVASVKNHHGKAAYLIATVEDIHERKLAEEALRASEFRSKAAQKLAKLGGWEWNVASGEVYWSPECFEIFGYEVNSIEPTAEIFACSIHPEDYARVNAAVDNILSGGEYDEYETYRIVTPAGETKFVRDYIEIVSDASGKVTTMRGATQDITAEMSMSAALGKSETRLAKVRAIARIWVWEWDIVNNESDWSKNAYELFGIESNHLTPTFETFLSYVHEDDRSILLESVEKIINGQVSSGETDYRIVTPAGDIKFMRDRFTVERDESGKAILLQGLSQDITKDQKAIAALEESEARLARAQAIAKVGYWEWDIQRDITICSPEINRIFERDLDSPAPDYDEYLTYIHPGDRERIDGHVQQFLAGQVDGQIEYRLITENGTLKYLFDQMEVKRDANGDITHLICSTQDITEFHQKTVALQESEARLAQAQKIATLGYWENDLVNNTGFWSEMNYELFGVTPDSFAPSYENFLEFVHPDDRQKLNDNVIQYLFDNPEQDQMSVEFRAITADGERKVLQAYLEVTRDASGKITCLRGTNYDITKEKQIIANLAKSEARLAKAQKIAKVGVWDWDLLTDTLSWSNEFYLLFDLEPQSIQPSFDLFISMVEPGDRPRIFEAIEILNAGEKVDGFEYRVNTPKGQKIVVEYVDALRNEAGEVTMYSGTLQDVTAFRQVNVALQNSESRFRSIFDQAALGIAQVNLDGQFVVVNQAFCDLIGYTEEEILGRAWPEISHPEDVPNCLKGVNQILAGDVVSTVMEKRYRHKQGHDVWSKAIVSCIYDENGQPAYILGLVEDITEYKKAADELIETRNRYADLVNGVHAIMYQYSTKKGTYFILSGCRTSLAMT